MPWIGQLERNEISLAAVLGRHGLLARALGQKGAESRIAQLSEVLAKRSATGDVLQVYQIAGIRNAEWLVSNARTLARCAAAAGGHSGTSAEAAASLWLRCFQQKWSPRYSVTLPLICMTPDALCWLRLEGGPSADGRSAIAPSPATALMFLESDLVESVQELVPAGFEVLWDLEPERQELGSTLFSGRSLSGAAAAGLSLLQRGLAADPACLIAAQTAQDEPAPARSLRPVGGEVRKLDIARKSGRIRRVILAAGHSLSQAEIHHYEGVMPVRVAGTVEEAAAMARILFMPSAECPMDDPFYLADHFDGQARSVLETGERAISIRGPSQTGKSSLRLRIFDLARQRGYRTALADGRVLQSTAGSDLNTLFYRFVRQICDQLGESPHEWDNSLDGGGNLRRCTDRLLAMERPLLIGVEHSEALKDSGALAEGFFSNLRALADLGADNEMYRRLHLVLITAIDPGRLIQNVSRSPFNIGVRLQISWNRWDEAQVARLNAIHGSPFDAEGLAELRKWVGGHPYLVRCCIHEMARPDGMWKGRVIQSLLDPAGPLTAHLDQLWGKLERNAAGKDAWLEVLRNRRAPAEEAYVLDLMGLCGAPGPPVHERLGLLGRLRGENPRQFVLSEPTCRLYEEYFSRRMR